jgi:hypothetical protein
MGMLGMVLTAVAGIAALVFGIQILIVAFKTSILWGLGSLFVPFVIFVFVAMHWEETKTPFFRLLIAIVVEICGFGLSFFGAASHALR